MKIIVNTRPADAPPGIDLETWLAGSEYADRRCAVAVNDEFVPRSAYASVVLRDGDRVDVLEAIGGG